MKKFLAILLCVALSFTIAVSAFAADVATTDPATSNPATSDPATSDPATSNPATSDPATSDPATSDPASSDPASSDPASSDPASSDPASSDPTTTDPDVVFTDVPADNVFATEIYWCNAYGLMLGYKDNTFKPAQNITRAQVCTVFYRLAGSPTGAPAAAYTDSAMIAADYVDAVNWAKAEGVMLGYNDGSFRPNQAITREEFVTVFYRLVGAEAASTELEGFVDAADVKAPFVEAMCWAVENGIIQGYEGGKILPQGLLTRGAMAAILYRCFTEPVTSDVETSDVQTSDVQTSDVETSNVETSDVETSNVETSNVETSNVETTDPQTTNPETTVA